MKWQKTFHFFRLSTYDPYLFHKKSPKIYCVDKCLISAYLSGPPRAFLVTLIKFHFFIHYYVLMSSKLRYWLIFGWSYMHSECRKMYYFSCRFPKFSGGDASCVRNFRFTQYQCQMLRKLAWFLHQIALSCIEARWNQDPVPQGWAQLFNSMCHSWK